LERADQILQEVGAGEFACLSDTSPMGFEQRLARLGERLLAALRKPAPVAHAAVEEAREAVARHDLAAQEARRLERVAMAARLLRWLAGGKEPAPRSFAEAA